MIKARVELRMFCMGLLIVVLGGPYAVAADQPAMKELFSDDFKTDTRKDYYTGFSGGKLNWKAGQLSLASGATLIRKIEAGSIAEFEATFKFPDLIKNGDSTETDLIFMVKDGKKSVASLRRYRENGKIKAEGRIMVWPPTSLLPEILKTFPLDADIPSGTLTASYRSGTVELVHAGKVLASGKIENGDRPVYAVTLSHYGPEAVCEKLLVRAPKLPEAKAEPSPNLLETLSVAAAALRARRLYDDGKFAEAVTEYEKALDLSKRVHGPEKPTTLSMMDSLASVLDSAGEVERAEKLFLEVLATRRRTLGRRHLDCTFTLNNLANLYLLRGDYAKADPLLQEALDILDKSTEGPSQPIYAVCVYNTAAVHYRLGRYAEAEPIARRASELIKKSVGDKHLDYAMSLNARAEIHRAMGELRQSEALFRESLAIYQLTPQGEQHPNFLITLHNLSELYRLADDYESARRVSEQAIQTFDRIRQGQDSVLYAAVANGLALVYHRLGDKRAEEWYRRSAASLKGTMGENHFRYGESLSNLAELYVEQGRWKEAIDLIDRSRRVSRRHTADVLPGFAEAEQIAFLENDDAYSLHMALSVGLARRDDATASETSATWAINGKALIHETLASRAQSGYGRNHRASEIQKELQGVRAQLARLALQEGTNESQATKTTARLIQREQELSKELGRLGEEIKGDTWMDLAAARQKLPADSVLVEIVRVHVRRFGSRKMEDSWAPARYVAWIIPKSGKDSVRVVDLGDAERIDHAVKTIRRTLSEAPATIEARGQATACKLTNEALKNLASLVLQPLALHIRDIPNWIISPDADLWLVPWAALPTSGGPYAIEKHRITYLISGRDLISKGSTAQNKGSVIMADPDFNLGVEEVANELKQIRQEKELATSVALRSSDLAGGQWPRLPGTAREAKAIAPQLAKFGKAEPEIYVDRRALEGVFKTLQRPRILVISTHGFFLEDQDYANAPSLPGELRGSYIAPGRVSTSNQRPPTASTKPKMVENALLRCGLVFAGANNRDSGELNVDDGLLTGLEIVGADLRDTDLVVLSACETGVGQVRNGEGVAGIRQAFHLAGARTVVATLWKVPDAETADLMSAYFENLSAGWSKADALRRAQMSLIKSQRDQHGDANPFYWAAFTITGDPGSGLPQDWSESPLPAAGLLVEPPPPVAASPISWLYILPVGIMLGLAGCWLAMRGRRSSAGAIETASPDPEVVAVPVAVAAPIARREFNLQCRCGARLRIKTREAEKRVPCPRCGEVLVARAVK